LVIALLAGGCAERSSTIAPASTGGVKGKLETSLHGTGRGMEYFYEAEQGGFEALTHIPYEDLACQSCHLQPADCGECHVQVGDTPVDAKCTDVCHSRQRAEIEQGLPDAHRGRLLCADCHDGNDVHGDGRHRESMLEAGAITASCENADCHPSGTLPVNDYHARHAGNIECAACHAQSVVTCVNCHFDNEVEGKPKVHAGMHTGWKFLVRDTQSNKISLANVITMVYQDSLAQVTFAPYHAHTITKDAITDCSDCHSTPYKDEYYTTGELTVVKWDKATRKLVPNIQGKGIIPVVQGWETDYKFDFGTIQTEGDPPTWKRVEPTSVGHNMLFAEPLERMP